MKNLILENFVLTYLGKAMEVCFIGMMFLIIFIDPIRGRLFEWGWLQIIGSILCMCGIAFSFWLDEFFNAIKGMLN